MNVATYLHHLPRPAEGRRPGRAGANCFVPKMRQHGGSDCAAGRDEWSFGSSGGSTGEHSGGGAASMMPVAEGDAAAAAAPSRWFWPTFGGVTLLMLAAAALAIYLDRSASLPAKDEVASNDPASLPAAADPPPRRQNHRKPRRPPIRRQKRFRPIRRLIQRMRPHNIPITGRKSRQFRLTTRPLRQKKTSTGESDAGGLRQDRKGAAARCCRHR